MSVQYRTESKDSTIETYEQAKARADAAEAKGAQLLKELEAVRADDAAGNSDLARRRRAARQDAKVGAFTYRKDDTIGLGLGVGPKAGHPNDEKPTDTEDPVAAAKARREARTRNK